MRTYDISRPPELINIGFDGENKWRPRGFNCTDWLQKHPDGIITLWIQPKGVRKAFPVSTTKIENTIVWYPLSEELYPGTGELQLTIQDGEYIGKSDIIKFEVNKSLVSGGAHPDSQPNWAVQVVAEVTEQADRAEEAASSIDPEAIKGTVAEAVADYLIEHPFEETDPTVPNWAKQLEKPTYTANEVGALPDDTEIPVVPEIAVEPNKTDWNSGKVVDAAILANSLESVDSILTTLTNRLNALADSDDTTLDQFSEIVAYIKNNKSLIDSITTQKVNISDIIDNLTSNDGTKPLSAKQGRILKELIDNIIIPTKTSDLNNDSGFITLNDVPEDLVTSVNNKVGVVVLNADDVGALSESTLSEAINNALTQAKESGEFDGKDGADGAQGAAGQDGADGYSPTVAIESITDGNRITITDKNGPHSVDVMNGADGEKGDKGDPGTFVAVVSGTNISIADLILAQNVAEVGA